MKRINLLSGLIVVLVVGAIVVWSGQSRKESISHLPWQIEVDETGQVEVFQMKLGATTLREMIEQFQHFPEIALFSTEQGDSRLEAYFGKRRMGVFDARLIAEIEADSSMLNQFIQDSTERKAQPSGRWKHTLAESSVKIANEQQVSLLVYMPVADYDEAVVSRHFGEPADKVVVDEQSNYWFYPQKGMAIFMNAEDDDILYYSAIKDFAALRQRLVEGITATESNND